MAHVIDLFAGAGGESTGILAAADRLGLDVQLSAVNHWETAIETHAANHPNAAHYCTGVDAIDPCKVVPGGRVALLWASPECTHHSTARGGRPRSDQSRASAWLVLKWLQELYVERLIIENVPEFENWGPLGADGQPLKSKKGHAFTAWLAAIEALGYRTDYRVLNAADFGAPTTRRRLFVQAVRGRERICWPNPTHSREPGGLFDLTPWRPARDIIDWSIPGQSIFSRKRPLSPNTLRRIETGIQRYWGKWAEPFLVILRGNSTTRDINSPIPTITASGGHLGLVEPFVTQGEHNNRVFPAGSPLPTITASSRAFGICSPFVLATGHKGRLRQIDQPLSTVVTKNEHCLVEPLILHQMTPGRTRPVGEPVPAITTTGAHSLIVPYYGTSEAQSADAPLPTVTCKDRFALVEGLPDQLDIRYRMFQPHELAAAQSFPSDYQFIGTKTDVVRQIGNAVPPSLAEALAHAALQDQVA